MELFCHYSKTTIKGLYKLSGHRTNIRAKLEPLLVYSYVQAKVLARIIEKRIKEKLDNWKRLKLT